MGIILSMAVQMILVAESNGQVSNAEQYGFCPFQSTLPAASTKPAASMPFYLACSNKSDGTCRWV
jgi:hypothetical protein